MGLTKSYSKATSERKWYVVDLNGQVLGRAATVIAKLLRGKQKATYTKHDDMGDFVVVINAGAIKLTGNKLQTKIYRYHTGYIGGMKEYSAKRLLDRKPTELILLAVKRMMPKTHLAKQQMRKLKIYAGSGHPHGAQKPEVFQLKN